MTMNAPTMTPFQAGVADRFGVLPNFFCTAAAAPGLVDELWSFARSAYLDSALPSLFKERLFVQLSRFCEIRYCIVRHVGFLVGLGRPAGDADAAPESVDDVIALLSRPLPDASQLAAALDRLRTEGRAATLPERGTLAEGDLFDALTVIFVEPARSARAREAVRAAVGDQMFEMLAAYLAFVRTAHFWTETHPELAFEADMLALMEERPDLQEMLLSPADAERVRAGGDLRRVLAELHQTEAALRDSEERLRLLVAELQHRVRNILTVIRLTFSRSAETEGTKKELADHFLGRLDAMARTQVALTRHAERTANLEDLIRNELLSVGVHAGDGVVTLAGPEVELDHKTAESVAMVLHELTTNALKYGALAATGATLDVTWETNTSEGNEHVLHLDWCEQGVPAIPVRPARCGFGRELIEEALPYRLGAETKLEFRGGGVRCAISVPLGTKIGAATA